MTPLTREEVLILLARFGNRSPELVDEEVGSLELTWLLAEVEQEREVVLDLSERRFASVRTVDDAVRVLSDVLGETSGPRTDVLGETSGPGTDVLGETSGPRTDVLGEASAP